MWPIPLRDGMGLCQQSAARPTEEHLSLWESRRDSSNPACAETNADAAARHARARAECSRCPLLDICEQALSDMERHGVLVDGVMAGRFSDLARASNGQPLASARICRGCRREMAPQIDRWRTRRRSELIHQGEGLCQHCWPRFSRTARHHTTTRTR